MTQKLKNIQSQKKAISTVKSNKHNMINTAIKILVFIFHIIQ